MFATFAILFISLHIGNAAFDTSWRRHYYPNKTVVLSDLSFDNETLYYAFCDQPPKQCTVVRITKIYLNPKTCRIVDLKADDVQLIVTFPKDRAILVALESTTKSSMLKTITVDMPSCKIVDQELFEIPSDWKGRRLCRKLLDIVVFDGGFEVIVKGFSQICSKPNVNKYCGYKFNAEGKRIEGPYIWPRGDYDNINVVSPILTDASGKGYFFVNENKSLIGVQADRKGGATHIKLWGPQNISSALSRGGLSVANNINGACYAFDSTIKCWQNDIEGGLTMSTELTFKHEHEIWKLFVHNLPDGGFIMLMITCPGRICSGVEDQYYLIKIDAQGKTLNHVKIDLKESKCNANNGTILAKILLDKSGSYCLVRLCYGHQNEEVSLEVSADCISDSDFLD